MQLHAQSSRRILESVAGDRSGTVLVVQLAPRTGLANLIIPELLYPVWQSGPRILRTHRACARAPNAVLAVRQCMPRSSDMPALILFPRVPTVHGIHQIPKTLQLFFKRRAPALGRSGSKFNSLDVHPPRRLL